MKAIDILINLNSSEQLLEEIRLNELSYLQHTKGFLGLSKEVSSSYSFITLEKLVKENKTVNNSSWKSTPEQTFYRTFAITHYITIADSIAQKAYNCTSGDDYRPGNFNEISVNDEFITLIPIRYII